MFVWVCLESKHTIDRFVMDLDHKSLLSAQIMKASKARCFHYDKSLWKTELKWTKVKLWNKSCILYLCFLADCEKCNLFSFKLWMSPEDIWRSYVEQIFMSHAFKRNYHKRAYQCIAARIRKTVVSNISTAARNSWIYNYFCAFSFVKKVGQNCLYNLVFPHLHWKLECNIFCSI